MAATQQSIYTLISTVLTGTGRPQVCTQHQDRPKLYTCTNCMPTIMCEECLNVHECSDKSSQSVNSLLTSIKTSLIQTVLEATQKHKAMQTYIHSWMFGPESLQQLGTDLIKHFTLIVEESVKNSCQLLERQAQNATTIHKDFESAIKETLRRIQSTDFGYHAEEELLMRSVEIKRISADWKAHYDQRLFDFEQDVFKREVATSSKELYHKLCYEAMKGLSIPLQQQTAFSEVDAQVLCLKEKLSQTQLQLQRSQKRIEDLEQQMEQEKRKFERWAPKLSSGLINQGTYLPQQATKVRLSESFYHRTSNTSSTSNLISAHNHQSGRYINPMNRAHFSPQHKPA